MVTWPLLRNRIRGGTVSNTFGMVRRYADGRPKPHQGWDLFAAVGTMVYAIGDGKVAFVRDGGDYGLQLCHSFVCQDRTLYAFYAHLQTVLVRAGETVTMRQEIGRTGISGNARNLPRHEHHLHFEIREHEHCGQGLAGRLSPLAIYGHCPLSSITEGTEEVA